MSSEEIRKAPNCPKCGSSSVKHGYKTTRKGKVQTYQCRQGHIFVGDHLPEDLR